METREIIILSVILVFVGFRLYQRYTKKKESEMSKRKQSNLHSSSSSDDDYEPYSKK